MFGSAISVTVPSVVIRPTWVPSRSMNHNEPSPPTVMPPEPLPMLPLVNTVTCPVPGSIREMAWPDPSVVQSAPSGPTVMLLAPLRLGSLT